MIARVIAVRTLAPCLCLLGNGAEPDRSREKSLVRFKYFSEGFDSANRTDDIFSDGKIMLTTRSVAFRIKLTVAVYRDKKLAYRNDMLVPTVYKRRSEARAHIKKELKDRLKNSNFFISPRVDFDLVRYAQEASCNTYLRYRIMEEETQTEDGVDEKKADRHTASTDGVLPPSPRSREQSSPAD